MSQIREYFQADIVQILEGHELTRTRDDFADFQRWMGNALLTHKKCLLGAFMGSGKTVAALWAARKLMDQGKVKRILVVAPLAVAKDTWPDELMIWDFARRFDYSVIVGTDEQREAARRSPAELHIINRENFAWLYERWGYRSWPYDLLIYDEASRLKGGSKRTKPVERKDGTFSRKRLSEFGYLRKIIPKFKRVWELTGTPAPNGLIDLWGPVYILDQGARLGTSRTAFEQRWFRKDPYTRRLEAHDHSEKEIMDRLKGIFYTLKKEDYTDLPPLIIRDRFVHLDPKHMRMYRKFERTLVLDEYDVEAVNSGVLCNKLLQFANGSIYVDEAQAEYVHDRKVRELESIVAEAGGRPVLIAYSYKFDVVAIKKRFPKFRVFGETAHDLRDWNRGKLSGLILHPASAGHGLNFQYGGNIAVWFGLNWSLELYQQFNERLPRLGQKSDHVWLYRILARNTNDLRVAAALERKNTTQDRITDAVRVHVEEVRRAA